MNTHHSIRQDIPSRPVLSRNRQHAEVGSLPIAWQSRDDVENIALRAEVASLVAERSRLESRLAAQQVSVWLPITALILGLVLGASL